MFPATIGLWRGPGPSPPSARRFEVKAAIARIKGTTTVDRIGDLPEMGCADAIESDNAGQLCSLCLVGWHVQAYSLARGLCEILRPHAQLGRTSGPRRAHPFNCFGGNGCFPHPSREAAPESSPWRKPW